MARKRKKSEIHAGELNLTAMIDVAFQLLSFFIITVRPVDVYANLNVFRPSPEKQNTSEPSTAKMIRIQVFPEGYTINERDVTARQLDGLLGKLAEASKSQTILIMCANAAPHEKLVEVLDLCAKAGLNNLSVVSSGGY
jgi:biopolymer transport protein ExbD